MENRLLFIDCHNGYPFSRLKKAEETQPRSNRLGFPLLLNQKV